MSMTHYLVRISYLLADSERYQATKRFVYRLLEDPDSRYRLYFDLCMMALVLASVTLLVYQTYGDIGWFGRTFEQLVLVLFIAEYLLRLWIHGDSHRILIDHFERARFVGKPFRLWPTISAIAARKWAYISSPIAIIDLLAIIPSYRPVRILRLFLLFRLFKVFRYANNLSGFGRILVEKRFELLSLTLLLAFIVFGAAAAMVIFEVTNADSKIDGFFDAIYWAVVTVSTVGYGDFVPVTPEGRVLALLLILAGLGFFSFLASIIVSAFTEQLPELRLRRVHGELERGGHTILCGFGRVGEEVARGLARGPERFVVVDTNEERYRLARRMGYIAVHGRAESDETLDALRVGVANRLLCLTDDDVINVYITVSARFRNPGLEIIARANRPENANKLHLAKADRVLEPYDYLGRMSAQFIGREHAFDAIYDVISTAEGINVEAIPLPADVIREVARVRHLDLLRFRLILFGVTRSKCSTNGCTLHFQVGSSHFYFNPQPDFELAAEDMLIVFGHIYSIMHFKEWIAEGAQR